DRVGREPAERVEVGRLLCARRPRDTGIAVACRAVLLEAANRPRCGLRTRRRATEQQQGGSTPIQNHSLDHEHHLSTDLTPTFSTAFAAEARRHGGGWLRQSA